jgi:hypothetical protein
MADVLKPWRLPRGWPGNNSSRHPDTPSRGYFVIYTCHLQQHLCFLICPKTFIMAEALGIVVSSIAVAEVAAKVGKSFVTLRNLWKEIENVPESISHLMRQIELINPILGKMEQDTLKIPSFLQDEDAIGLALRSVYDAKEKLVALVEDLSRDINSAKKRRRAFAKVKVVLNAGSLSTYEARLRGAIQYLTLAHQLYLP